MEWDRVELLPSVELPWEMWCSIWQYVAPAELLRTGIHVCRAWYVAIPASLHTISVKYPGTGVNKETKLSEIMDGHILTMALANANLSLHNLKCIEIHEWKFRYFVKILQAKNTPVAAADAIHHALPAQLSKALNRHDTFPLLHTLSLINCRKSEEIIYCLKTLRSINEEFLVKTLPSSLTTLTLVRCDLVPFEAIAKLPALHKLTICGIASGTMVIPRKYRVAHPPLSPFAAASSLHTLKIDGTLPWSSDTLKTLSCLTKLSLIDMRRLDGSCLASMPCLNQLTLTVTMGNDMYPWQFSAWAPANLVSLNTVKVIIRETFLNHTGIMMPPWFQDKVTSQRQEEQTVTRFSCIDSVWTTLCPPPTSLHVADDMDIVDG